jgi:hypothetical protein
VCDQTRWNALSIHPVRPLWPSSPTSAVERSHSEAWEGCIVYLSTPRSSLADDISTSLVDGIVLVIITTLLSEPFALYLPAQFAGYPLHEPQVALP